MPAASLLGAGSVIGFREGLPAILPKAAGAGALGKSTIRISLYSHGEYWHCASASIPVLMISGRGEGASAAASVGGADGAGAAACAECRGECTGASAAACSECRGECAGATSLSLQQCSRI